MSVNVEPDKSSEEEEFEDAVDNITYTDLELSIVDAKQCMDLFLRNRNEDAKAVMEAKCQESLYHALGYGTICYLHAVVTMEPDLISNASEILKSCIKVTTRCRRRGGIAHSFSRSKSKMIDQCTDLEVHAELCYAELNLLRAAMHILENENMMAWVKATMRLRDCYRCYKDCWKILHRRTKWQSDTVARVFESGTRMGIGMFNLLISMMPPKVLKLMEFVGYSGDRRFGLQQLGKAAAIKDGIRSPLCSLTLTVYHIIMATISGFDEEHLIQKASIYLDPCLATYPESAIYQCLKGRILVVTGDIDRGIHLYNTALEIPNQWPNLLNMFNWELIWAHAIKGEWILAVKYCEKLAEGSMWSKSICYYMKAAFLLQCMHDKELCEVTSKSDLRSSATKIMEIVPAYAQRIAGKSIPFEKFIIKKSQRYLNQGERLVFPALEVMLVWNVLKQCVCAPANCQALLTLLNNSLDQIKPRRAQKNFQYDDYALLLTMKANILRKLDAANSTIVRQCLQEVLENVKLLKYDIYLAPVCEMELVYLAFESKDWFSARRHLENARSYKDYTLESRMQVRMQSAASYIKSQESGQPEDDNFDMADMEELADLGGNDHMNSNEAQVALE